MISLQSLWLNEQRLLLNGVFFSDGYFEKIDEFERESGFFHSAYTVSLVSSPRVLIDDKLPLETSEVIQTCQAEYVEQGIVIAGGEGGWGGDGFVAVTDLNGSIQWIAHFDFSNPFIQVELVEEDVVGINNHGEHWHFPLANPGKITIRKSRR